MVNFYDILFFSNGNPYFLRKKWKDRRILPSDMALTMVSGQWTMFKKFKNRVFRKNMEGFA